MKLNELLTEIFKTIELDEIKGKHLEIYETQLKQCDEFKDIEDFKIIKKNEIENLKGIRDLMYYKLIDDNSITTKCHIYRIFLSPEIYDPKIMYNSVKDGACITPAVYDMETFKPIKKICIEFSPELLQNELYEDNVNTIKNKLIETFKNVLENPNEYQAKGERHFIISGIFN